MRATVLHAPRDVRSELVPDPTVVLDTDALVRVVAGCVCGWDPWPFRGENAVAEPTRIVGTLDASPVFDQELPLNRVAEAYAAMDERRAIKSLLRP